MCAIRPRDRFLRMRDERPATERRDGRRHRQSPGLLSRRVAPCTYGPTTVRAWHRAALGPDVRRTGTLASLRCDAAAPLGIGASEKRASGASGPPTRVGERALQRRRAARCSSMKRAENSAASARRSRSSLFMSGQPAAWRWPYSAMAVPLRCDAACRASLPCAGAAPCARGAHAAQPEGSARPRVARCAIAPATPGGARRVGRCFWHATRLFTGREVRSNLHHLQDR